MVIALAVACHNLIELGGAGGSNPTTQDAHLFSLILMAPLAGCTYGLAIFNWFPAQVGMGGPQLDFLLWSRTEVQEIGGCAASSMLSCDTACACISTVAGLAMCRL